MKILVILAHPDKGSFNHAVAAACVERLQKNGHDLWVHDLYAENFDPRLPHDEFSRDALLPPAIQQQCDQLAEADGIIIVHPNWWGQPPALLKGWIDRVIRPGVAYAFVEGDSGEGTPIGLLKAKAVLVFNTANTAPTREKEVFGDPLENIWKQCIFGLCGVTTVYRRMFTILITSTDAQRKEWLAEAAAAVDRYFP